MARPLPRTQFLIPGASCHGGVADAFRPTPYTRSHERAPARTPTPVRVSGVQARPGAGRARRSGRTRHARADADRLGEVAHLPARGDAAADADARALTADRADEGPGGQAPAGGRGPGDADQLVARRRRVRLAAA